MTKTESDLFFSSPKSEKKFQQHWESEYFFRKKNITQPPPPTPHPHTHTFKLNGLSLTVKSNFRKTF